MTSSTNIFPWITDNSHFSTILSHTELLFNTQNPRYRQRYIGWRLWSLQKSSLKGILSSKKSKFYFEEYDDTYLEYLEEEDSSADDSSDEEDFIPHSLDSSNNSSMLSLSQLIPQETEEDEKPQLHHSPSYSKNLNLYMLNNYI